MGVKCSNEIIFVELHQFLGSIKIHVSQPDCQQAPIITTFCTQVPDLGMTILVNVTAYPAILSLSRSQNAKKIADQ